jgi:hypothetical protein
MIVTHGGLEGGYGLYVRDSKPKFVYNYLSLERYDIASTAPLSKGKVQIKVTSPMTASRASSARAQL